MAHQEGRRPVEAHDQKAAFVVDREVERPAHPTDGALAQPPFRGIEQGGEDRGIVLGFEKAEMAEIRPLPLLNQPIHLGADPAGGPAVAGGAEQRGPSMPTTDDSRGGEEGYREWHTWGA